MGGVKGLRDIGQVVKNAAGTIKKGALVAGVALTPVVSLAYNADATDLKSALPSSEIPPEAWALISLGFAFSFFWTLARKGRNFIKGG